jgi:dolichol kinase
VAKLKNPFAAVLSSPANSLGSALSCFLFDRTGYPKNKKPAKASVPGTTAGFASSFFVSFRRQASVILADGSHYVPFAAGAIRSFLTHCTLRPSARSGLFFHAQS